MEAFFSGPWCSDEQSISQKKRKKGEVLELCSRNIKTCASDNDCCRCRYPRRDAQVPPINVIYKINYIHL